MMRRVAICLAGFLSALLPYAGPATAAPFVVGTWYGQGQPFDKHEMWLDHLLPDGSFHGEYRACTKGKAADTSQTGYWSMTGDTVTISIITVDGFFNPRTDVYKNLSHAGAKWSYRFLADGFVFNAERVANDYKLTSCETIS